MQIITNLIVILSRAREIFDREFQDFIDNEIVRKTSQSRKLVRESNAE
jgi:hypothetical protein